MYSMEESDTDIYMSQSVQYGRKWYNDLHVTEYSMEKSDTMIYM